MKHFPREGLPMYILVAWLLSSAAAAAIVQHQDHARVPAKSAHKHERSNFMAPDLSTDLKADLKEDPSALEPLDEGAGAGGRKIDKELNKGEEVGSAAAAGEDPGTVLEKAAGDDAAEVAEDVEIKPVKPVKADKKTMEEADTAAELTGVKTNNIHGEFETLFMTGSFNLLVILICLTSFSVLRKVFPLVYCGNLSREGGPPACGCADKCPAPGDAFLGWISASLDISTVVAANAIGLDGAMFLEYISMCVKILSMIGVPMVCIMCPLHFFFGNGEHPLHEISSVAMGNVMMRHPWLYYLHAIIVNVVTYAIINEIYSRMTRFLYLRFAWLKGLPSPRCTTVLVEGIPEEHRSDEKLRDFFNSMFGEGSVIKAYCVKNAPKLKELYEEQQAAAQALASYGDQWELVDSDPEQRPMMSETMCGGKNVDAITYWKEKLEELEPKVTEARNEACAQAKDEDNPGGINTGAGFVTYIKRRKVGICMNTQFTARRSEWIISAPPPASDVLWNDLKLDVRAGTMYTFLAYFFVGLTYAFFIPLVVLGTNLTHFVDVGPFQAYWAAFAPGLSLMLCLGFLPTILLIIFRSFFTLKSDVYAQNKLQIWYFGFLVFFVILVTTIGTSLVATFNNILKKPGTALELLADNMPNATHFYLDFLMLQCVEQAVATLRNVQLIKYYLFSRFHDPELAKTLAEPEDQDYYGLGARNARFTINLCIAIIFSTLSPLIAIVGLCFFWLSRLFYGYLVVFAETKKADLGGVFFVTSLHHVFMGVGIYNLLMIAVLSPSPVGRARSMGPFLITLPSIFYTLYCHKHFSQYFVWTELPFTEACFHVKDSPEDNGLHYIQPEFISEEMQAEFDEARGVQRTKSGRRRASYFHEPVPRLNPLYKPQFLGEAGRSVSHSVTPRTEASDAW